MRRVEADNISVQMEEAAPPPYSAQDAGCAPTFSSAQPTQNLPLQLSLRCDDVRLADIDPCSSAASYFEDRPCSLPLPSDILEHRLVIPTGATREELRFPCPQDQYRHRDITDMDWSTFQNFLLPNWIAPGSGKASSRWSNEKPGAETQDEVFRRARVEVVIAEWNECFFGPRGVRIHYDFQSTPIPIQTPPPPFVSVLDIEPIPSASPPIDPTIAQPSTSRGKQKEKHQDFWSRLENNRHHTAERRDRRSDCHSHRKHRRWGRGRRSSSTSSSSSSSSSSSDSEGSGKGGHFHHHHHGGHRWKSHRGRGRGRGRSRGRAHHSHRSASTSPSSAQSSDTAVEPTISPALNASELSRSINKATLRLAISSLKDEIHHHRPHRELKDQLRAQKKLIKADVKALIREGKAAHRGGEARRKPKGQSESLDLSLGLPLGLARRVTAVKI